MLQHQISQLRKRGFLISGDDSSVHNLADVLLVEADFGKELRSECLAFRQHAEPLRSLTLKLRTKMAHHVAFADQSKRPVIGSTTGTAEM